MGDGTGIEWTDATLNPMRGCARVSEGCRNCYAEQIAGRFCGDGQPYEGVAVRTDAGGRWTREGIFLPERLEDPLRWRKPRKVFVNSMSDVFFEAFSFEQIAALFAVMYAAPRHTFQVLTKRPARGLEFFQWLREEGGGAAEDQIALCVHHLGELAQQAALRIDHSQLPTSLMAPNIWLGVSVEDQAAADERIPGLFQMPAGKRFLSCEPLLGPLRIRPYLEAQWECGDCGRRVLAFPPLSTECFGCGNTSRWVPARNIDWVIVGGESGRGARRMLARWSRELRDDCVASDVPFFFKQWGRFNAEGEAVGKKKAGRELDGRTWDQYPRG